MAGKRQNKLVYYDGPCFSEEHEIPIHLIKINLKADYQNHSEIEINAVIHYQTEVDLWKKLIDFLSPYKE